VVSLVDPKTEKSLCHCLQNCNLQAVTTEVVSSGGWFLTTRLSVEFQSFPKERYRRTLIFTKTDILSEWKFHNFFTMKKVEIFNQYLRVKWKFLSWSQIKYIIYVRYCLLPCGNKCFTARSKINTLLYVVW
jgi:hypothetical protein